MITVADYERADLEFSLREMKRVWRIHAAIYAVVITGLTVLNLLLVTQTDADFLWFFFPLVGWGIGLTMHYLGMTRWGARDIARRQASIEREAESSAR